MVAITARVRADPTCVHEGFVDRSIGYILDPVPLFKDS